MKSFHKILFFFLNDGFPYFNVVFYGQIQDHVARCPMGGSTTYLGNACFKNIFLLWTLSLSLDNIGKLIMYS